MEEKERYRPRFENCIEDNTTQITYCVNHRFVICDLLNQQAERIKELCKQVIELNKKNNILRKFEEDILRVQEEPYRFWKENQQLKQELQQERAELEQLYSHLGVEAFGEDIQEQAVKKFDKIEEENQQLKQQLAEWQDGTIICKWTNAENKVKELEQQVEELEENYKRLLTCFYSANKRYFEILDKYEDINFKFKQEEQQLHDLPKKIVRDVVDELEKVLVLIHNAVNIDSPEYDLVGLYDAVSDKIKQLKEMK